MGRVVAMKMAHLAPLLLTTALFFLSQKGDLGNEPASSGPPACEVGVIVVYDIFAFKVANTRAQCDRLARTLGCSVVLPDFYRGGVSPMSDPSLGDFETWMKTGNRRWESVERDLDAVMDYLKTSNGCTKFAILGFCWGGYIALEAATTGKFACAIGVHTAMKLTGDPSGECLEHISRLKCPLMLLQVWTTVASEEGGAGERECCAYLAAPWFACEHACECARLLTDVFQLQAGNDPDLRKTAEAMRSLDGGLGDKCVARTFWDCDHGWAAARVRFVCLRACVCELRRKDR
jgi:pimeloyl-ACP methyl ester carboxylesterase